MANLNGLNPIVREATERLIANCEARGVDIRITQGYRSISEQNTLFAQGRTKPGEKVTDARGGQSYHNYGLAIDFCLLINGKQASWSMVADGDKDGVRDWAEVVNEAKRLGFAWGGDWSGWKDYPHFEMTFGLSISDLQRGKRPPTGITAKAAVVNPGKLIQVGSSGKDVERIQRALGVKADGVFGKGTESTVKEFQKRKGLKADGIVGRTTWEAMF